MSNSKNDIVSQAQELIDQVRSEMKENDDFYTSHGLDPEKVRMIMHASTEHLNAAQKEFEADMAESEQFAHEEMARKSFNRTSLPSFSIPFPGSFA